VAWPVISAALVEAEAVGARCQAVVLDPVPPHRVEWSYTRHVK
jgi:hypothetical protein